MSNRRDRHGDSCRCESCQRLDDAAAITRTARERAGLSAARLGQMAGERSRAVIREMEDVEDRGGIPHADVWLVPDVLPHVIDQLADRCGRVVVELPRVDTNGDDLRLLAEVQRETSEAVTAHLDGIADGVLTRQEVARSMAEVDQAILALVRLRERLRAVQREPVVGVRGVVAGGRR